MRRASPCLDRAPGKPPSCWAAMAARALLPSAAHQQDPKACPLPAAQENRWGLAWLMSGMAALMQSCRAPGGGTGMRHCDATPS